MRKIPKRYQAPFAFAVALHLFLLIFLVVELPHHRRLGLRSLTNTPQIIHAEAVSQDPIEVQKKIARAIARKKALARQRKLAYQRKQAIARRKKALARQKKLADQKKQALARKKAALAKARQVAQARKLVAKQKALQQKLLAEQLKQEQAQLAKTRQLAIQGMVNKYMSQLKAAIQQNWHQPFQNASLFSEYQVHLAPGGVVLGVKLVKSSGNPLLDRSGRLAILKSSPLPVPKDPLLFNQFRYFTIKMSPKGMAQG